MAKCKHGRQRWVCKECGGGGICEHGRVRSVCKECGGGSICEHGRVRSACKECCSHVTILDATEVVLELEGEEEPDEELNTVQGQVVVARPRGGKPGGKRKREA